MVNVGADSKCNYYAAGRQRAGAAGAEAEAQRDGVAKGVARVRGNCFCLRWLAVAAVVAPHFARINASSYAINKRAIVRHVCAQLQDGVRHPL